MTSYATFVQTNYWAKLAAGTYGAAGDFDASEYAAAILANRTAQNYRDLVAWDISKLVVAASDANQPAAYAAFLATLKTSLEAPNGANYRSLDVLGLAGGLWAAASTGAALDPTVGAWASSNNNAQLAAQLAGFQTPGGGFVVSTTTTFTNANADAQTTAYAMLALAAVDPALYRTQIAAGFNYLQSLQVGSGQFLQAAGASPTDLGSVEAHGETLEAYALLWVQPDRYVAPTGTDSGDCTNPAARCRTIQYAVNQADVENTIHIAAGTYVEPTLIEGAAKNGLRLVGDVPGAKPILSRVAGPINQRLLTIHDGRNVVIENLFFDADLTFIAEPILANGNVDGLVIRNNDIRSRQSVPATTSSFGFKNAISINRLGSQNSPVYSTAYGAFVTIQNNVIAPAASTPADFRAGIAMDGGVGLITANDITGGTHDMTLRFFTTNAGSSGLTTTVGNNAMRGRGLEIVSPNASASAGIFVTGNQLFAPALASSYPDAADFSLVRLTNNPLGSIVPTVFSGNTFSGHANFYRGVLVQNWPGATFAGNTFTPKAGATDFVSLVVSNKEINTVAPPTAPAVFRFSATGNTFNGSGVANSGRAVELIDDNDAGGTAAFETLAFGGNTAGQENSFDGNLRHYFRLDNHTCQTHLNTSPAQCNFLGYTASIPATNTNTQVRPYAGDVGGRYNTFGGIFPAAMNAAQKNALLARTQDRVSNIALGLVDYGFTATQPQVFVDDAFIGSSYGDAKVFTHGATAPGTVYFGVNAFATISDALTHVAAGGQVFVAKGTYPQAVAINALADVIGDGSADANGANSTVITGGITLAASGTASDTLLLQDFRTSNASGNGITLGGSHAYIALDGVSASGNVGNGFMAVGPGLTQFLTITDSHFDGNGHFPPQFNGDLVSGLNFAESASGSDVTISNSTFDGNNGAGLVVNHIGSASSLSEIRRWTITGSFFRRNIPVDTTLAVDPYYTGGGGIWFKTGTTGSVIDSVLVQDSIFEDNGTGQTNALSLGNRRLNANGITLRARPGTTLTNVRLCGNTFRDTATPGTQDYGVLVFNDTTPAANFGPVELCGITTVENLDEGVTGVEQAALRGTQPVVNITGTFNVIGGGTAWNYITLANAQPVVYVDDAWAGNGSGTMVDFAGNAAPAACAAHPNAIVGDNAFASVHAAVQRVSAGGTVCVASGKYAESSSASNNLLVGKPVSIFGAQYGVDARTRNLTGAATAAESVLLPAVLQPGIALTSLREGAVVSIAADNVVLDGFTVDADNPAIVSPLNFAYETPSAEINANPDADTGIYALGSGTQLRNLVVRSTVGSAVFGGDAVATVYSSNLVTRSRIAPMPTNASFARAIILFYNYYASVTDNLVEQARVGLYTENHYAGVGDGFAPTISGNTMRSSRTGLWLNLFYNGATPTAVTNNSFTAIDAASEIRDWAGVWIESMGGAQTLALSGNAIDGGATWASTRGRAGYLLNNITSTAPAASRFIDGGSVSRVDIGVLSTDATFFSGPVNDFIVRNVAFSNTSRAALYVEDTSETGSAKLTIGAGNTFAGTTHPLVLSGAAPAVVFADALTGIDGVYVRSARNFVFAQPASNAAIATVVSTPINLGVAAALPGSIVGVEAGTYPDAVTVSKSVTVAGPHAGVAGDAPARGSNEATLAPASAGAGLPTRALVIGANNVVIDGLSFTGLYANNGDVALASGGNYGASGNAAIVRNNRFVTLQGNAIYTNGPGTLSGWQVHNNLFDGSSGGGFSAINLWKMDDASIQANVVRNMAFAGVQLNGGSDIDVLGNDITNTGANGINIGPNLSDVRVSGNIVSAANALASADEAAVVFFGGSSNVSVTCNSIDTGGGLNAFVGKPDLGFGSLSPSLRIFHNAVSAAAGVGNANTAPLFVGSNWYDGSSAPTAPGVLVASALGASPIGNAACGNNTASALQVLGGSPQSQGVNQPFASALRARLVDGLGGAVRGANVAFIAPGSGASAQLSPATAQSTDFDGAASVSAIANSFAGTYAVTASSAGVPAATFTLTNTVAPLVQLDLNGPVGGVEVGDTITYSGLIANQNPAVNERVFVRIVVGGTSALNPGDVQMCVVAGPNCVPIPWTDAGATLTFDFPGGLGGVNDFDITAPYSFTHFFRAIYGKAGVFSAAAQVIGVNSGTVYASDMVSTEVIAQHAGITLDLNGPVAGVERDAPTNYSARLTNTEAAVVDPVVVEFVLTRDGGIVAGDVLVEYDLGGGNFAPIPLFDEGGALSADFGGAGFLMGEGYDATTHLRVTFHDAPDTYHAAMTVKDASANADGVQVYAADQLSTDVIEADSDVDFSLDGPFASADATAITAARVGTTLYFRSLIENNGVDIEDAVIASFALSASFVPMSSDDLDVTYWFPGASNDCSTLAAPPQMLTLTPASDMESLVGTVGPEEGFTLAAGDIVQTCFAVTYNRAATYSLAATLSDAASDTDSQPVYATTNLGTVVGKGQAVVTLSGLGPVTYDGATHAATASVVPNGLTATVTYDGNATPLPVNAGNYAVVGSVNTADWEGSANGTLVIAKQPVQIVLGNLTQVYDGAPKSVSVSTTPSGIATTLTYAGNPAAQSAPGSYLVVATVADAVNYSGSASAILKIVEASDISIDLTGVPPMALIGPSTAPYTDFVDYVGELSNAGSATAQNVHYAITVTRIDDGNAPAGQPAAIALGDVKACLFDPSGWQAQEPGNHDGCEQDYETLFASLGASNDRAAVTFRYPNNPAFDIPLPATGGTAIPLPAANFRFKRGEFHVQVDVVGSSDGTVYASSSGSTTVPNASVNYSGAMSGPTEAPLLSQTLLRNDGGPVVGNVIVRVTLSDAAATDAAPITLANGDADLAYQLGADYAALAWQPTRAADGGLVTFFGPPSGFPLADGYIANTAARAVFHRIGNYHLRYDVLDAATLSTAFAQQVVQPITIGANAVNFVLSDLTQTYDGTPRNVTVTPANVPRSIVYEALAGASCPVAPSAGSSTAPTDAGTYCVWVNATGTYTGSASGVLTVAKATTTVTLVDTDANPGDSVIERTFNGAPQVVQATAAAPIAGSVQVTYNGGAAAPSAAGTYVVNAVVVDPNWQGSTTGSLVIGSTATTLTLASDPVGAATDASSVPVYTRSSATTANSGAPLDENVLGRIAIARVGGTAIGDLALDYFASFQQSPACVAGDGGWWCPLPLADNAGTLEGTFGPAAGFPFQNATSQFRTRFSRGGHYVTTVRIVGATTGAEYASGARHIDVAELALTGTVAMSGNTGTAVDAAIGLRNTGTAAIGNSEPAPNDEFVVGRFTVASSSGALTTNDVAVTYLAGANYLPIALTANAGVLSGEFGPPTGFPVAVGYDATTLFRNTFLQPGTYTVTTRIVGVESGAVFDTLVQTVNITASNASIVIDPASLARTYTGAPQGVSVSTTPAGLDFSVTYDGSSTPPTNAGSYAVVATITEPGFSGSTSGTLVIAKATAQVTLANLVQVYDGTPKSATAFTMPSGLSVTLTYTGSPTPPTNVGTYTVQAVVDDMNYAGASNGTLTILAAAIVDLQIDGSATFTGIAGAPLVGMLPSARVLDSNGNGVAGVSVFFEVTAGEGSATGTLVTTDSTGRATVGSWTLGRDAGSNTLTARVPGQPGLPTLTYTAQGEEVGDVGVSKTSATVTATAGDAVTYTITVSNAGPSNAAQVDLLDALPAGLENASWICAETGAALCSDASGSGDVEVSGAVPVGSTLVITLTANIANTAATGALVNEAAVTLVSGDDTNAANDTASHSIDVGARVGAIFSDGFEDDEPVPTAAADVKSAAAPGRTWTPDWSSVGTRPVVLMELKARGRTVAALDALRIGGKTLLRSRQRQADGREAFGPWSAANTLDALKFAWSMSRSGAELRYSQGVDGFHQQAAFAGPVLPSRLHVSGAGRIGAE